MSAYQFLNELKAHLDAVVVGELFGNDTGERIADVKVIHQERSNDELHIMMESGIRHILTIH